MQYEVFIPSAEPDGYDVTITVEADNWMIALKSGLERVGEGTEIVRNVMCDIKSDNSIHVTDASSQRVFVLRELGEEAAPGASTPGANEAAEAGFDTVPLPSVETDAPAEAATAPPVVQVVEEAPEEPVFELHAEPAAQTTQPLAAAVAEAQTHAAPSAESAKPEPAPSEPEQPADEKRLRIGSSTHEALRRDEAPAARVLSETRQKTDERPAVRIGRADEKVSESLLEDVFLEIQDIFEGRMNMQQVIDFVMDMAVDKIGAESGSILFVDVNGRELYFATARGPKADAVMDFRVPMGQGIVGFCAREGVSLAIGDAQQDPRFYREISRALGYETRSLLCAPIQHKGRIYGAIELINKSGGSSFTAVETNALSYMGRKLANYVHDQIMAREKLEA